MSSKGRKPVPAYRFAVFWLLACAVALGAVAPGRACESNPAADTVREWQVAIDPVGVATAPSADTFFTPAAGQSFTYLIKNTKLYAIANESSPAVTNACGTFPSVAAGSFRWPAPGYRDLGRPVVNFGSPVPISASRSAPGSGLWCHESIFVGTFDGLLFKINAADGTLESPAGGLSLRRTGCAQDTIVATPAVQLYDFANASFRSAVDGVAGHAGDDLVFVITRYNESTSTGSACYGGGTRNRIYGIWAKDLSVKWVFNANGQYSMGYGSEGCSIDYENNTLYCGTSLPSGASTGSSLWALDTVTGKLRWSANAGPLVARPMVGKDATSQTKVFTASNANPSTLAKYGPDGDGFGGPVVGWQTSLAGAVQRNVWPESRSPLHSIFALDVSGNLHHFVDAGTTAVPVPGWPVHDAAFQGMPVFNPDAGKLYIGRSDGRLQQIDMGTASKEGAVTVGTAGTSALVGDAVLDALDTDVDVLAVSAEGYVIRKQLATFLSTDNTPCGAGSAACGPGGNGTSQGCLGYQSRNTEYDPCNTDYFCDSLQSRCVALSCSTSADCTAPAACACPSGSPPCAGATGTCVVPDGTPCDDNKSCTFSFSCTDVADCAGAGDGSFTNCVCLDGGFPPCSGGTGYCRAASCAGGPYGDGSLCNNVCQAGRCTASLSDSCPCVNAGDPACGLGQACCGSTATAVSCGSDADCGVAVCPGGNGSCQWSTTANAYRCRCGQCADLQTDGSHCGSCSVNCAPTDANNPSSCLAGVCDGSVCTTPSAADLAVATSGLDADAVAFDRNGPTCSGYLSFYSPKVVRKVTTGGSFASATTLDAAFLSGVAVPKSGTEIFGAFINDASLLQIPGLAQGNLVTGLLKAASGIPTSSTVPFFGSANTKLNYGPVGPALNYFNYAASTKDLYFGNWLAGGDLYLVHFNGIAWTASAVSAYSGSGRITALAFERRPNAVGQTAHSTLYVGHGTILSIVDVNASPVAQIDVDLANPNVYTPGLSGYGDAAVTGIRSIAVNPKFGDIYVEVGDANGNSWIMNVDEPGHAARHHLDVQKNLDPCLLDVDRPPNCVGTPAGKLPPLFSDEGRIVMTPDYELLRIARNKLTGAVSYTEYRASRCSGADCN